MEAIKKSSGTKTHAQKKNGNTTKITTTTRSGHLTRGQYGRKDTAINTTCGRSTNPYKTTVTRKILTSHGTTSNGKGINKPNTINHQA